MTAFKAEKNQIESLNGKLETVNSDLEIEKDKYSKTREAQKLAEVKVMELEQRLSTLTTKAKESEDAKGMNSIRHSTFPFILLITDWPRLKRHCVKARIDQYTCCNTTVICGFLILEF